ncbi:putative aminotransferase class I and II family protein [Hypoxylon sp. NC1633]|nr:putative aminotransferase class I and II family protein [Hypoxylon sp. NC1633]
MPPLVSQEQIDAAIAEYKLSRRAAHNSQQDLPWDTIEKMSENLWTPENPDGLVFLGVAENPLLHHEVVAHINNTSAIVSKHHLGYGIGPRGSPRLKKALVSFIGSHFRPCEPVLEKDILILPGVVAVIDALTWSICNDGEGIIVPVPFYTGFGPAVSERARGVLIPAEFQSIEGYRGPDDILAPEMNKKALENSMLKATRDGVKVRAVMLTNPHNPLGRCYPEETLKTIARFCGHNNLHLIVDEVFANSVYDNPQAADVVPFTSILGLSLNDVIDRQLIHVAYGMGKDFGATGLRLGVLHSRNQGLVAAVSSICVFGWLPYVAQDMWANMLEDQAFLTSFLVKNREILTEHCAILRAFLDQHEIPFYTNVNAGVFIWVDLGHYISGGYWENGAPDLSVRKLSAPGLQVYQDRERKLLKRCLEYGIGISPGSNFSTEQLGWFRISFTVEKQALDLGLRRLLECLKEIEADGWTQRQLC